MRFCRLGTRKTRDAPTATLGARKTTTSARVDSRFRDSSNFLERRSSHLSLSFRALRSRRFAHRPPLSQEHEMPASLIAGFDKCFAAAWLDHKHVVLGTKDNALVVMDVDARSCERVALPARRESLPARREPLPVRFLSGTTGGSRGVMAWWSTWQCRPCSGPPTRCWTTCPGHSIARGGWTPDTPRVRPWCCRTCSTGTPARPACACEKRRPAPSRGFRMITRRQPSRTQQRRAAGRQRQIFGACTSLFGGAPCWASERRDFIRSPRRATPRWRVWVSQVPSTAPHTS